MVFGWLKGKTREEKQKSLLNMVNKSVSSTMKSDTNLVKTDVNIKQEISLNNFDTTGCTGDLNINNKVSGKVKVAQSTTKESFDQFMNKLSTDLADKSKTEIDKSEGVSDVIGGGKESKNSEEIKNIKNITKKSLTLKQYNAITTSVNIDQLLSGGDPTKCLEATAKSNKALLADLDLKGAEAAKFLVDLQKSAQVTCNQKIKLGGKSCNLSNEVLLDVVVDQMAKTITKTIMKDEMVSKAIDESVKKQKESNFVGGAARDIGTGLGDAAKGVGQGFNNIFGGGNMGGIISSCLCCTVAIIGGFVAISMNENGYNMNNMNNMYM